MLRLQLQRSGARNILQGKRRLASSTWLLHHRNTAFVHGTQFSINNDKMGHLSEASVSGLAGGSFVHVSVNSQPKDSPSDDFLPLTVDYRFRDSAYGLIPASFKRREKNGSDEENLVARFIDRAIRPLFPSGYVNEVQVIATNHALDGHHDPTVIALNATSLALMASKQPWFGPIGCVRVGMIDGNLVVNPPVKDMQQSTLDLLYAGTKDRTVMIEALGKEIPENTLNQAIDIAHAAVAELVAAQERLISQVNKPVSNTETLAASAYNSSKIFTIKSEHKQRMMVRFLEDAKSVYRVFSDQKGERGRREGQLINAITNAIKEDPEIGQEHIIVRKMLCDSIINAAFRAVLLEGTYPTRSDGRPIDQLRKIESAIGVLPSVHGSSYFQRGDTHVLSTVTLGPRDMAKVSTALDGSDHEKTEYFFLHYDFPPYCNGKLGNATSVNRRMIGHGNLAERALRTVIPSFDSFPFAIRVMSECTSSNGSSSMATVCSGTLALLEAGVPIVRPVAGLSIGLVTDSSFEVQYNLSSATSEQPSPSSQHSESSKEGKYVLLTDILGSEDHHGDMDFKVAGTERGVTAIQLDVKLQGGLPLHILKDALVAARKGRIEILNKMYPYSLLNKPKENAPRAELMKVDPDRMTRLLGHNGEMLKYITKTYDVVIDILEDDKVYIYGSNLSKFDEAASLVRDVVVVMKPGDILVGTVTDIKDFGVFIKINQGQEALLHMSQMSHDREFLKRPLTETFQRGQRLRVQVLTVDESSGMVSLTRKALFTPETSVPDTLEVLPAIERKEDLKVDEMISISGGRTKFPVTPPRSWSQDFFRHSVASKEEVESAIRGDNKEVTKSPNKYQPDKKKGASNSRFNKDKTPPTPTVTVETESNAGYEDKDQKESTKQEQSKRRRAARSKKSPLTSQASAEALSEVLIRTKFRKTKAGKGVGRSSKKSEQKSEPQLQKNQPMDIAEQKHDDPITLNLGALDSPQMS